MSLLLPDLRTSPACQSSSFTALPHAPPHTTGAPHIHGRGGGAALKIAPTSTHPLRMSPSAFQPLACPLPGLGSFLGLDCAPHQMDILMCSARLEPDLHFPFF
uniref:Uncharacterized protein n=1 Tax=Micrurus lemniscatus lemniscatus TaxID=129467 RepID=A0A2D4IBJ3_MICLE